MAGNQDVEKGENLAQEEVRAPLLAANGGEERHPSENSTKESRYMVYISTLYAVCGSYALGTCIGYSSPTQLALSKQLNLSSAEYSAQVGTVLNIGALIGAITCGKVADCIGRKMAMHVASGFCTVGWLFIFSSETLFYICLGRWATGCGIGALSYVVPLYIAEIAPKELRGALLTLNQLMIVAGVYVSFVVGPLMPWQALAMLNTLPCAILQGGADIIPDSPRWLARQGNRKEFEESLRCLRGKNADISAEAAQIKEGIEKLDKLPKAKRLDLFQRRYLRSLTIGVGLMVFQQFGGINGVSFYASSILETAGFPADNGTINYALFQVIFTAVGAALIDRAGRKPLLVISGSGLAIGSLLIGSSFYMKEHGLAPGAAPALAVSGILVYIGAFSAGMGAVPWLLMSEILPINIKGSAGGLATVVNWSASWACSYTFSFLMSWSSCGTFIVYAAVNALAIVFVVKVVPETKGRLWSKFKQQLALLRKIFLAATTSQTSQSKDDVINCKHLHTKLLVLVS